MKLRLLAAFVLGFALAYWWQHKPAQRCALPADAPQLRDILYDKPWPKEREA